MDKNKLLPIPAIVLVIVAALIPSFILFNYAFQVPYGSPNQWVGFAHFQELLDWSRFTSAVSRTFQFVIAAMAIEIPLGITLAHWLREKEGPLAEFTENVIVLPALLPWITIGLMWRLMIQAGPITQIMDLIPVINFAPYQVSWHAFGTLVALDVWHWTSLIFIVALAGLGSIPEQRIEAAKAEGASSWQIFRYVELPEIRFPLTFVVMIRFMDTFRMYDEINVLTGGGPGLSNEFIVMFINKISLERWELGTGAAASLIALLMVLVGSWAIMMFMTRGEGLL